MRFSIASSLVLLAGAASAASTWGFSDAVVKVASKADESKEFSFSDKQKVTEAVRLGQGDKLKVSLTAKDGSKAKRPHQAFLLVKESSGLEAPFPLEVKDSGKGAVELVR
jgi:oligosaccharyltransferase complex subunit delta (ribophorin II)